MLWFESNLLQHQTDAISLWKRYIDDIFMIWTRRKEQLEAFVGIANSIHPDIPLTFEISQHQFNFLDLNIYIDKKGKLQTTMYRKPIDKNLLLQYTSAQPLHQKRNLVYTQALRYRRNVSEKSRLASELNYLREVFAARGYPLKLINNQFLKAINIPWKYLLQDKHRSPACNTAVPDRLNLYVPLHPRRTQHEEEADIHPRR